MATRANVIHFCEEFQLEIEVFLVIKALCSQGYFTMIEDFKNSYI